MNEQLNLKSCPFCGKPAVMNYNNSIHCSDTVNCGAQVESGVSSDINQLREWTINAWNKRVEIPVCTTCGKPKDENTFCSNAFHVIQPLYIQRDEERYKNIPDWYGGDDYINSNWKPLTVDQLKERHKELEKKLGI